MPRPACLPADGGASALRRRHIKFIMKTFSALLGILLAAQAVSPLRADVLTSIPGPDDQGGMIMPMISLTGNALSVLFSPPDPSPLLASLSHWSPGDSFSPSASWHALLDPVGGAGALFNNQYGVTFMGTIPSGKALGIRLLLESAESLKFWNYVNSQNLFDEVFTGVGGQVLWNGGMWHHYVTLPANAAPGIYSATFEVFIADATFASGTGRADYSPSALAAAQDPNYSTATITYSWEVIPEPSAALLAIIGWVALICLRRGGLRAPSGNPARPPSFRPVAAGTPGFTLVETLLGLGTAALLTLLVASSVKSATGQAKAIECLSNMRALSQAILLHAQENGRFPRSLHSAASAGELPWSQAILPYLGETPAPASVGRIPDAGGLFRCPSAESREDTVFSYGLNVFMELDPDGDDYEGSPATWRSPANLPSPSATVLLGEARPVHFADHFMCHMWSSDRAATSAVDARRHGNHSVYAFADGHVESLPIEATFSKIRKINRWNPSLASSR